MAFEIKIEVIHAPVIEQRKRPDGTTYFQRQLQCFIDEAVAVHTVYGSSQEELEAYQRGFYMADLRQVPGDRARATFQLNNLRPVAAAPTAKAGKEAF